MNPTQVLTVFDKDSLLQQHQYAAGPSWRLYHGDCVELMNWMRCILQGAGGTGADNVFDLIFADPPYLLSNGGSTCQSGRRASVNKGQWDQPWDYKRWMIDSQHLLKPTGTIWISGTHHIIFDLGKAMLDQGFHVLNTITWFKPNASPNLACRYFTHSTEFLIWAAPDKFKPLRHTFNYQALKQLNGGKQMRDMWTIPTVPRSEKKFGPHSTQKPLTLLRRIITASAPPQGLILDPFNGSGTTGVAALEGRHYYIGIDSEVDYLELTKKRLNEVNIR
jgi:site-specific DNA-methyltransferase (adenine-specific)